MMNGIDKVITNRNYKRQNKDINNRKEEYNYILGLYIRITY